MVDIAPSLKHEHQPYVAFFEDHTLPNKMKKRLHDLLEKAVLYMALTPLSKMVKGLLRGESWINAITKRY